MRKWDPWASTVKSKIQNSFSVRAATSTLRYVHKLFFAKKPACSVTLLRNWNAFTYIFFLQLFPEHFLLWWTLPYERHFVKTPQKVENKILRLVKKKRFGKKVFPLPLLVKWSKLSTSTYTVYTTYLSLDSRGSTSALSAQTRAQDSLSSNRFSLPMQPP